jgi:hypothetical protein
MVYYSVGTSGGAIAATTLYSLAGWGAVSALGAGLSALALLVWSADRIRQRGSSPQDPVPAAPAAGPANKSRQPAREHP